MDKSKLIEIRNHYKSMLVDNVLSFWLEKGIDRENGGIYTALDRDGALLDTDKSVWFQGRAMWVFATAYVNVEPRAEYLDAALSIANFTLKNCFDKSDGRMYFRVSKDGKPVIKRLRYFFSETFAVIGFAALSTALRKAGRTDEAAFFIEKARSVLSLIETLRGPKSPLIPKFDAQNRPCRAFGEPMIMLNVISELRRATGDESLNLLAEDNFSLMRQFFIRDELKAVVESCKLDGTLDLEHFEGRMINPGHAIEGSWFLMQEGIAQGKQDYVKEGLKILEWMWELGWDEPYKGIIQYRDVCGKSLSEYHHDMKFWWPQCEAAIANLYAYSLTKEERYFERFLEVDSYIDTHFVDHQGKEWFGYLHRDGSLSTDIKGNMYKGPFHIPRFYMVCIDLLDKLIE